MDNLTMSQFDELPPLPCLPGRARAFGYMSFHLTDGRAPKCLCPYGTLNQFSAEYPPPECISFCCIR